MSHSAGTTTLAIVGAGTTVTPLARQLAEHGHRVLVYDEDKPAADRFVAEVRAQLVAPDIGPAPAQPQVADSLRVLASAGLVIETGSGERSTRADLLGELEQALSADCVIATLTSALAPPPPVAGLTHPGRVVGLHLVEPFAQTKLAEIVVGPGTDEAAIEALTSAMTELGNRAVRATAAPGFSVDRLSRPFFAEAWQLWEQHVADPVTIDAILTRAGGFAAGPFTAMNDIGHDVSEAVARAVWIGFDQDPRFAPSWTQRALVQAGYLGDERGRGRYDRISAHDATAAPAKPPLEVVEHGTSSLHRLLGRSGVAVLDGDSDRDSVELPTGALMVRSAGPTATALEAELGTPVIVVDRTVDDDTATAVAVAASDRCPELAMQEAIGLLQDAGLDVYVIDDVPGLIVARTVAVLANFAVDALHCGVASAADIDAAMRIGAGHPIGPLEWGDRWGARLVVSVLDGLLQVEGNARYRACALLRRYALSGMELTAVPDRRSSLTRG